MSGRGGGLDGGGGGGGEGGGLGGGERGGGLGGGGGGPGEVVALVVALVRAEAEVAAPAGLARLEASAIPVEAPGTTVGGPPSSHRAMHTGERKIGVGGLGGGIPGD